MAAWCMAIRRISWLRFCRGYFSPYTSWNYPVADPFGDSHGGQLAADWFSEAGGEAACMVDGARGEQPFGPVEILENSRAVGGFSKKRETIGLAGDRRTAHRFVLVRSPLPFPRLSGVPFPNPGARCAWATSATDRGQTGECASPTISLELNHPRVMLSGRLPQRLRRQAVLNR
jgi:hypothetical protein